MSGFLSKFPRLTKVPNLFGSLLVLASLWACAGSAGVGGDGIGAGGQGGALDSQIGSTPATGQTSTTPAMAQPVMPTGVAGPQYDLGDDTKMYQLVTSGKIVNEETATEDNGKTSVRLKGTVAYFSAATHEVTPVPAGRILKIFNLEKQELQSVSIIDASPEGKKGYFEAVVELPTDLLSATNQNPSNAWRFFVSHKPPSELGADSSMPACEDFAHCSNDDWAGAFPKWEQECSLLPCLQHLPKIHP